MSGRKILALRRLPRAVADPADNVLLRCAVCGARWPATLGEFGDEIPASQAVCRNCSTEPPKAA